MPSAEEAFRRFWRRWIGTVAFPPVMFVANEFYEIPGPLLMALFFILVFPSMTPFLQKKAPFGYWGLVCAAWMGSGFLGVMLLIVIRWVMGVPLDGQG